MAGAFWCIVEDDRQGNPKKVTAEVLGEAARLAAQAGGQAESQNCEKSHRAPRYSVFRYSIRSFN